MVKPSGSLGALIQLSRTMLDVLLELPGSLDETQILGDQPTKRDKDSPELAAKAQGVLEEIEREATSRRDAFATLFGSSESSSDKPSGRSGRKTARQEPSEDNS